MKRALLLLLLLAACGRTPGIELPDPPKKEQPLVGCTDQSVVYLEGGRTLMRVSAQGSTKLFTFGAGLPDDQVGVWSFQVEGDIIGAAANAGAGTFDANPWEYVLLDTDGKVLFHQKRVERYTPQVYLGADGSLAVASGTGFIARPDGTVVELGDLLPLTGALPDGSLVVAKGDAAQVHLAPKGLWKNGAFTALEGVPAESYDFFTLGSRALYLGDAVLISVTEGRRIALPSSGLGFAASAGGRWVMLSNDTALVLVDVELGTARALTALPLPAMHPYYNAWNVGLQADGAVLAGRSENEQLQLIRSTDLGASWNSVGQPMAMGPDFGLGRWILPVERSGSVLAMSMSTGYGNFLNEVQLISPWGVNRLPTGALYSTTAVLSTNGQCAATWAADGSAGSNAFGPANLVFLSADGSQTVVSDAHDEVGMLKFVP